MIALKQARQHLETLGLKQAVEVLDNTLDAAANKQLPYPEMLAELLGVDVDARRERYLTTRTRLAHLPLQRTLEQFDFAFQPSIDERLVKELANHAFVAETTNPPLADWDRPAWARPISPSPWPSKPSSTATALTSSAPTNWRGYSHRTNNSTRRRRRPAITTTTSTDRIAEHYPGGFILIR